jgi:hypothetical protein
MDIRHFALNDPRAGYPECKKQDEGVEKAQLQGILHNRIAYSFIFSS